MYRNLITTIATLMITAGATQAQVIANWTFEASIPTNAGPYLPEIGSGEASGFHADQLAVYSNPVGNGSAESYSANYWAIGDYWQFKVSTLGFSNIGVSFDQTSSTTGPRDFRLRYSLDGSSFTDFADYSVLANSAPIGWTSGTYQPSHFYSFDLSNIDSIENVANVYFRLESRSLIAANGGAVATTGTDRIDNFAVAVVPEPSTFALAGLGLAALLIFRRRQ